jgi:Mor family transcriptional regulator
VSIIYKAKHKNVKDKEEEIITAYLQGESIGDLARKYAVSLYVVDQILIKNNIQKRTYEEANDLKVQKLYYNDNILEKYKEGALLYQQGIPLYKIIKQLNIAEYRLVQFLKENSIPLRTRSEIQSALSVRPWGQKIKGPDIIQKIIEEYNQGVGCVELAQKYNVVHGTIRLLLKRNGIKFRTCKETQSSEYTKNYIKQKNLNKYGVVSTMQLPEVFEKAQKSMFKYKTTIIEGVEFQHLRGYEEYGIRYILEHFDDVIVTDILAGNDVYNLNIPYNHQGKDRVYFPDIFIPKFNCLVEVKSDYTYNLDIDRNIAKKEAAEKIGYTHITLIFDKKGNLIKRL